jgi:pyruvate/2-oxoglutarate dehydrogenase complex dihydrolipoamide acyltransferase (E2) component
MKKKEEDNRLEQPAMRRTRRGAESSEQILRSSTTITMTTKIRSRRRLINKSDKMNICNCEFEVINMMYLSLNCIKRML